MRLQPLKIEELPDVQRSALREARPGRRGHIPNPMLGWNASPEFARRAQHLGAFLLHEATFPPRLSLNTFGFELPEGVTAEISHDD